MPLGFRAWMKMVHLYAFLGRWCFGRFWWIQREWNPFICWPFIGFLHSIYHDRFRPSYIPWRIQSRLVWCNRKSWFLLGQWVGTCIIHHTWILWVFGWCKLGRDDDFPWENEHHMNEQRESRGWCGLLSYWLGFNRLGITCSVGK